MSNPFVLKGRIYQVIFEHGPMTYAALLKHMPDVKLRNIRDCLIYDRFNNKDNGKKVFRIIGYEFTRGKGGSPQPIVAIGNEPDVPSPVLTDVHRDAKGRYEARRKILRNSQLTQEEKDLALEELKLAQANAELARGALVFQNMFSAQPSPHHASESGQVHKTSNKEPIKHGQTQTDVSAHLKVVAGKRTPVNSGTTRRAARVHVQESVGDDCTGARTA